MPLLFSSLLKPIHEFPARPPSQQRYKMTFIVYFELVKRFCLLNTILNNVIYWIQRVWSLKFATVRFFTQLYAQNKLLRSSMLYYISNVSIIVKIRRLHCPRVHIGTYHNIVLLITVVADFDSLAWDQAAFSGGRGVKTPR